jgi:hypothetical protein
MSSPAWWIGQDLGANRRWPTPVNGHDDVLEFAEVFLPDALTAIVDPAHFE